MRCSAAATRTGPPPTSTCRASSTRSSPKPARATSSSAARATRAAAISKGSSRPGPRNCGPVAAKELGIETGFSRDGSEMPLYAIEPVASIGGARDRRCERRAADEDRRQHRAAEQVRPERVAALDPACRGRAARRRQLSRRRPPERAAAQRGGAGRGRRAPLRLHVGRPHSPQCRRRPPLAAAGRRDHLDRPAADRIRRAAAGGDAQAHPDDGGQHPLPDDEAEAARRCAARMPSPRSAIATRCWRRRSRCST